MTLCCLISQGDKIVTKKSRYNSIKDNRGKTIVKAFDADIPRKEGFCNADFVPNVGKFELLAVPSCKCLLLIIHLHWC